MYTETMQVLTASDIPFDFDAELTGLQSELKYFVLSLTGSIHDAEEVIQETNRIALQKVADFEPGTNLKAWVFTIASRQAKAFHRNLTKKRGFEIVDDEMMAHLAEEEEESDGAFEREQEALVECLKLLRPAHQELVTSRYVQGRRVADLAVEQDTHPNALAQKLFRIRTRLAECIENRLKEA